MTNKFYKLLISFSYIIGIIHAITTELVLLCIIVLTFYNFGEWAIIAIHEMI
jgi:hypothetical protein